jgi:hypothetical protein
MAAVAAAAVVLGGAVEVPRVCRRWEYALKRLQDVSVRLSRLRAVMLSWRRLPRREHEVADLIAASGNPAFARRFFTPNRVQLLYPPERYPFDRPPPVSPDEATRFLETYWGTWWREEADRVALGVGYEARAKDEFRFASVRPWLPVPGYRPMP